MAHSDHFLPLYDKNGDLYAVMLSGEFWSRHKKKLEPRILALLEEHDPADREEPLHEWEELKTYWDFKYPYCADVLCRNCGAHTDNWLEDPNKPFTLKSAGFGGLAVFVCNSCGAFVRKKHFKDHMCFEFSLPGCGCS